jgi:hypothetical protein
MSEVTVDNATTAAHVNVTTVAPGEPAQVPIPVPDHKSWLPEAGFLSGTPAVPGTIGKPLVPAPVMHGKAGVDAVKKLVADLAKKATELKFEVGGVTDFGHGLMVYDPQSGAHIVAARPHLRAFGRPAVLLTCDQVVQEVVDARRLKIAHVRAMA